MTVTSAGRAGLVLLAVILLASCAGRTFDDHSDAAIPIAPEWNGAQDRPGAAAIDIARYWTTLGDPVLTGFVEQAIVANLDIAQGAARLAQARAGLRGARAQYAPQVAGNVGVQRDIGDFAQTQLQPSIGADVSYDADLFGRISGGVRASRADLEAAGYSLADVQRLIVAQVALATINARVSALQIVIARDSLRIADDNLQIADWRRQAGLVSSLDVEQARAQRAQTAATIPQFESNLAASANAIATLIGEPPGGTLQALAEPAAVPAPPEAFAWGAPADALRRRPDIRTAEATLAADTARIGVARTQLLPFLRLTGNLGTAGAGLTNVFDVAAGGLFAGLSQLIYDGGRARAQIEQAEALAQGSLAVWRRTILTAFEEVETAGADLAAGRARVVAFDTATQAAGNAALLARSQYQAGLTDFRTLLTAENQLLTARNQAVGARGERAGAFVRLTQALGGGWTPAAPGVAIVLQAPAYQSPAAETRP